MTDIDPKSDIELHTADEHVIVRVPLAGPVTEEWLRRYQRLARARSARAGSPRPRPDLKDVDAPRLAERPRR